MGALVGVWGCSLCGSFNDNQHYCAVCGRPRPVTVNPQDYQSANWPIQSSGANYIPPYFVLDPFDLWFPAKKEKPKPVPKPAGIKCTDCTRLIELRDGRWQRVHSSKSDKTRPDYVCIKSKDKRHHAPAAVALTNLSTAVKQLAKETSSLTAPVKKAAKSLSELYDEFTGGEVYTPLQSTLAIAGKVIPSEPWSVCSGCGERIKLSDTGLWLDNSNLAPSLCIAEGCDLHLPAQSCPFCLAPARECAHVKRNGYRIDISHSQWTPRRWLVTGCCSACWRGDLLGDLEDHCGLCPCCDIDGVSRTAWTDNMGKSYLNPLEVPRSGPASPFPFPRGPYEHRVVAAPGAAVVSFDFEWAE